MLAFLGIRAAEVTIRRLEHNMRPEFQFHSRTPRRHWALALAAAMLVMPGARWAFDSASKASEPPESGPVSTHDTDAQGTKKEPNFVVIPIRTDLQRKLLNVDESVLAVIELNGYGLIGKRDGELLRAIDEAALRASLSALPRRDVKVSVGTNLMYFYPDAVEIAAQATEQDRQAIDDACRAIAAKANLAFRPLSSSKHPLVTSYNEAKEGWQRLVAASRALDVTQETADESAEEDDQVLVYPVRTKSTQLLRGAFLSTTFRSTASDCVVYILKPLDANDNPIMNLGLCKRIKDAVWKLELSNKNLIEFHVAPAGKDSESWQRSRDAISKRMVGEDSEAQWLAKSLGFKTSTVVY